MTTRALLTRIVNKLSEYERFRFAQYDDTDNVDSVLEDLKAHPSFNAAMTKAVDFGETKAKEYGKKYQEKNAKTARGSDQDWCKTPGYFTWQANTSWSAWDSKAEEAAPWHQQRKGDVDEERANRG